MSRGPGPQQRRLVELAGRFRGVPVCFLAEQLGVGERRARKVAASCVRLGLVVVEDDPWTHDRRIWTPDAHWRWRWAQHRADAEREKALLFEPRRTGEAGGAAR